MRFGGEPLGLDPQCFTNGAALLFARPHDVTIVPTMGEHRLKGVVKRIHGIGLKRKRKHNRLVQTGNTGGRRRTIDAGTGTSSPAEWSRQYAMLGLSV